jgi:hypothetical protein
MEWLLLDVLVSQIVLHKNGILRLESLNIRCSLRYA